MPWFTDSAAVLPNSAWVKPLVAGALTACFATAGAVTKLTVAFGQEPGTSEGIDLNAAPVVVNGRISRPTLESGSQGEAVVELQSLLMLLGYYDGPLSGVYQDGTQAAVRQFQTDAGITPDGVVGPATWSSLFPTPPGEANPPGGEASTPSQPSVTATNAPAIPTTDSEATATTSTQSSPSTSSTGATPSPDTTAPEPSNRPVLRRGDQGAPVRQLQTSLQSLGFYNGPIDGIFGSQTESAVRQAQAKNNLTVDGIVGPATWQILN
jgi:N-acetylmuramoyl-L-alanine amidase